MFFVDVLSLIEPNPCDFRKLERGVDYFVDFSETEGFATLTTDCRVQVGDIVLLSKAEDTIQCLAKEVDYYWDDSGIRTVLLKLLTEED